jgi:hypothetical protein
MHYYEKNIVDIKNEYTTTLVNTLTPLIYEGIKQLYEQAIEYNTAIEKMENMNVDFKNPGILKIFQKYLAELQNLNNNLIKEETNRIKEKGKCSDTLDDLIKAVIKSNIILLTFNVSDKKCKLVNQKLHEKIVTDVFIHKCYIECGKLFFNYPTLFWHEFPTAKIKDNQREAYELIKVAIAEAIRKSLPLKLILEEYLKNEYFVEPDKPNYLDMKSLIDRDINGNKHHSKNRDNSFNESISTHSGEEKYDISVNRILDTSEEEGDDIEEKISDIQSNAEVIDFNNLVLNKMDTNLPATVNQSDVNVNKTAEELEQKLKDPRYVTEPPTIKRSKNPFIDEINKFKGKTDEPLTKDTTKDNTKDKSRDNDNEFIEGDIVINNKTNIYKTNNKETNNKETNSPVEININKKISKSNTNNKIDEKMEYFDKLIK